MKPEEPEPETVIKIEDEEKKAPPETLADHMPEEPPSDPITALRFLASRIEGYAPSNAKRLRLLSKLPANQKAYSPEIRAFAMTHRQRLDGQVRRAEAHHQELEKDGAHAKEEVALLKQAERRTKHRRDAFRKRMDNATFK